MVTDRVNVQEQAEEKYQHNVHTRANIYGNYLRMWRVYGKHFANCAIYTYYNQRHDV